MTAQRAFKSLILLLLLVAVAGILGGGPERLRAQNPAQKPEAPQAVGSVNNEDCAVCHEDLTKAFAKTPHVVLEKSPKYNLKNSCESCHGPGEAHTTSDGDKTKILSFTGPAAKTYNQQCLSCHKKSHELVGFAGGMHAKSGLACSDCHKVHSGAAMTRLLKDPPNKLCLSCHIQRRADFAKPFHHRVTENAMRCIDCHQPHGGLERRQLRASFTGEAACQKCHTDKAGPFVFEHASLRVRDCSACHEPHGSNNTKMLVRSTVRALCLECHSTSRNILSSQPPAFHDVRSPRYQNCTTCHTRIHGSNASRLFLR